MTRRLAATLLEASGLGAALRLGPGWRGLLVLCYHRIPDPAAQQRLDDQVRLLTRHFDVVAPSELLAGPDLRRQRLVALTFDDGYREQHALGLDVLRSRGVRAAFFVATGYVDRPRPSWWDEIAWMVGSSRVAVLPAGRWLRRPLPLADRDAATAALTGVYKRLPGDRTEPFLEFLAAATGVGRRDAGEAREDWMTWDMVRDLRDAGMDVGGHTVDHPVLARLPEHRQRAEIERCRRRLAAEGLSMELFSYPVGLRDSFDDRTRASLAAAGVQLAFSLHGGYVRDAACDPYDVPRASVDCEAPAASFRALAAAPRLFARW